MFVLLKDTNKNLDGYVIREHNDYDLVLHKPSMREYKKLILKGVLSTKHDEDNVFDLIRYSIINFQHENKDFTKYIVEHYKKVFNDGDINKSLMLDYLRSLIVYFIFYKKPINTVIINYLLPDKGNSDFFIKTLNEKIIKYNKLFETNTNAKKTFFNRIDREIKKLKNGMVRIEQYNWRNSNTKYEININNRYWYGIQEIILRNFT